MDIFTYNPLNTSGNYTNYLHNRYAAELIGELCGTDIELSGSLALNDNLLKSPMEAYYSCVESFDTKASRLSDEKVTSALIMAQFKVLYPIIEKKRLDLISKYRDGILNCLPWTNDYSEVKLSPFDMELRDLIYKAAEIGISQSDKAIVNSIKDARNQIAHNHLLSYEQINELIANCSH